MSHASFARAVRATLTFLVVAGTATFVAPTAPTASAAPAQDPGVETSEAGAAAGDARLSLLAQPTSVAADGQFTAFVAIEDAPEAVELAVDIYDRAGPTDLLGEEPPAGPVATFPVVELPEGTGERTSAFTISLYQRGEANPDPAWGYRIDEPGAYPVRVRVRDADQSTLAVFYTALVRDPDADDPAPQPTQVALVVEGHRSPPADPAARAERSVADPELLEDLTPVVATLDAHPTVPATYALTPDAVARMANDDEAATTLAALRRSLDLDGRDLLDAPYVDIDPATLIGAGIEGELTNQRDLGRGTLTEVLEPPLTGSWRVSSRVDATTLDALRQRGIFRTVLSADAVRNDSGVRDPAQVTAGGSTVRVATASPTYAVGEASTDDPVLAAHLLLARLAAAATDRTEPAEIVVDIDAGATDEATLDLVLGALEADSPWYASTPLATLLDASATIEAELQTPDVENLGAYPGELVAARRELASYASMVGKRVNLIGASERTLATSAATGLDLEQRRADVDRVRQELGVPFGSVQLPPEDTVTLGARDASFPLTISSTLDSPAQVVIQLQSSDRLEFPEDRIVATLDGERTTVPIRVRTRASGDTTVRITIRTPDDGVVLAESRYVVRSTAISGVGLLLTLGTGGFLAVWWGRHWWRARRDRQDPAATGSPPEPEPEPDVTPDPA